MKHRAGSSEGRLRHKFIHPRGAALIYHSWGSPWWNLIWWSFGDALIKGSPCGGQIQKAEGGKHHALGACFLRRWPESPGSACCTAMLLQITTICILGSLSPVACPPLRQSLSLGWPVRPGLGSTDKIKEVKEKIGRSPLKAHLLKGHYTKQCWGSPLLPALPWAAVSTSRVPHAGPGRLLQQLGAWLRPCRLVLGGPAGFKLSVDAPASNWLQMRS